MLKRVPASMVKITKDDVEVTPAADVKYLFTTKTCPNCAMAKEILKGEEYVLIDAEENPDLVVKYGVMQAPTFVLLQNGKTKKYSNLSNIKKYMEENESNVIRAAAES